MARRISVPGDWLTRASMFGAAGLVLIGALVLTGWAQRIDLLMQLQPGYMPVPPTLALSLVMLGGALLAREWRINRAVWLAALPALIGGLALAQYATGWNLHIDEFLLPGGVAADVAGGRLSRLTALSLLGSSLCLLWLGLPRGARYRPPGVALVSSLVISIGAAPLLARLLGLSEIAAWNQTLRPSPFSALCLVLLGHLLLSRVWRDDPARAAAAPGWLPVPVTVAGITLTLLFAAVLRERELGFVRSTMRLTIDNAATVLNYELDNEAKALQRMAARWTQSGRPTPARRDQDGEAYQQDFPALRSLVWVDETGHTRWLYPVPGNEHFLEYDHRQDPAHLALIEETLHTGRPAFSSLVPLPLGGDGFLICAALPATGGARGQALLGEFHYPALIETIEKRLRLSALYVVTIAVDGRTVFERSPPDPVRENLREESVFQLFNQRIQIGLAPSTAALRRHRYLFPELVTGLGVGLSLLLGVVAHLGRTAYLRHRAAGEAYQRLVAENEERRRAEVALRASQAAARKLALVASSTDNLVAITGADGRIEWINDSCARQLGFSLSEVIGCPLAQLLVSPDTDPALVVRLRDALLQGAPLNSDLVCHARDGRRYHLHLDLQPVRSQTGGSENFIAMLTDVTARVETEAHLRRAKEEADAVSRAKSEFLATMSHEIRTPMNGVLGMTSLLRETPLTDEQRDYVGTIRASGEALLSIINDILDFSKIEAGKMELEQHPFELSACLEEALSRFAVQAAAKRIALAYFIDPGVPSWMIGDDARLRQVLVNLLNNAIKFTPHGHVSIEARRAETPAPRGGPGANGLCFIEIVVRDTGIGIPAEKQGLLFRPFSQVDSSSTRKYGGTGLGLVICERLCGLMGGEIRVESEPGRGSAFTCTIPVQPIPPASRPPSEMIPASLKGCRVLAVDGHAANRRFLSIILAEAGLACQVAESAQAALALAARLPAPALLITDQSLPDGEGRQLALDLRRLWRQPQLPVLLLLPADDSLPPVLLAGLAPALHLFKPLRVSSLLQSVRSLFAPAAAPPAP